MRQAKYYLYYCSVLFYFIIVVQFLFDLLHANVYQVAQNFLERMMKMNGSVDVNFVVHT
jgi:hypothetical protein